jgi:hypothetical protein
MAEILLLRAFGVLAFSSSISGKELPSTALAYSAFVNFTLSLKTLLGRRVTHFQSILALAVMVLVVVMVLGKVMEMVKMTSS